MRKLPFNALQEVIYHQLLDESDDFDVPLYDEASADDVPPYITFGTLTCDNADTKSEDITNTSIQIVVVGGDGGIAGCLSKKEVNNIAEKIVTILATTPENTLNDELTQYDFFLITRRLSLAETSPDENMTGYKAIITFKVKTQYLGG